jgi:uroporphyrinogen-III synthase
MPRVLITRDSARASAWTSHLSAIGIQAVAVPVTRTVDLSHEHSLPSLDAFSWCVFTSVNAVAGLQSVLTDTHQQLPANVKLAVVGPATADLVAEFWRLPDIIADPPDAGGLADSLIRSCLDQSQKTVFWPCADSAHKTLPVRLRAAGFTVHPWVCYRTESLPAAVIREQLRDAAPWNVAVFAAPSAVRAFLSAMPLPWPFAVVAIGPSTAQILQPLHPHVIVSASPTTTDLRMAILAAAALNLSPSGVTIENR